GGADHGWLDTRHTFSFARYYDPRFMGFRGLRVMNEDRVAAGGGFPLHPHRDMEIVTYPLAGALEHRDTLGNGGVIEPGQIQRMSAGTGIRHAEMNAAPETTHFYQIWIEPRARGLRPGYEDVRLDGADPGFLRPVATPEGGARAVALQADARILAGRLVAGQRASHVVRPGRAAWLQVVRGKLRAGGQRLAAGDGAFTEEAGALRLDGANDAEVLLFDLA
ncbi:MAG: pirin family protein, partial [Myxococcota bacterium]